MSQGYKNIFGTNYRTEYFEHHKGLLDTFMCAYCGKLIKKDLVTVDHVVPKSKFWANIIWDANKKSNLACACQSCNSSKGAKVDLRILQGILTILLGPVGTILGLVVKIAYNIGRFFAKVGLWAIFNMGLKTVFKLFKKIPLPIQILIIGAMLLYLNSIGVLGNLHIIEKVKSAYDNISTSVLNFI